MLRTAGRIAVRSYSSLPRHTDRLAVSAIRRPLALSLPRFSQSRKYAVAAEDTNKGVVRKHLTQLKTES